MIYERQNLLKEGLACTYRVPNKKGLSEKTLNPLLYMVVIGGLEPPTPAL